ncbi:SDR family oxidoreductase [Herbiconiux sp. A18JL235]|uniref:SDR family oxidoreductase n=1 Tax=Herbiconiux sp. A18JL235 TaxID=3152363 RepID=A0AB39BDZ3_9MICO
MSTDGPGDRHLGRAAGQPGAADWARGAVAVVTGGTSGIGRATAQAFAAAGAAVVVAGRRSREGAEVVDELTARGAEALFVPTDVAEETQCARLVATTLERFGRLDIACNAAGRSSASGGRGRVDTPDAPVELWDEVMTVDARGTWLAMKHQLRPMVEQGSGVIVNVASVAGLVGIPGSSAYVAAKHAVVGMTKAAALEVAALGVRVNAVCPGPVHTPMLDELFAAQPERREAYRLATPLQRPAEPAEVAAAIVSLSSPAGSYLTGAAIPIDGGWTAR